MFSRETITLGKTFLLDVSLAELHVFTIKTEANENTKSSSLHRGQ